MHQCTPRYKNKRITEYAVEAVSVMREAMEAENSEVLGAEELIAHINRTLHWAKRISYAKFAEYCEAVRAMGQEEVEEQELYDPTYGWLYDAYMEIRFDQKKKMFGEMRAATGNGWIMYRWTMERVFPDFDLRQRSILLKQKAIPKRDMHPDTKPTLAVQATTKVAHKSAPQEIHQQNASLELSIPDERSTSTKEEPALKDEVISNHTGIVFSGPEAEINQQTSDTKRNIRWMEPDGITLTSEDFKAALLGRSPKGSTPPSPS